MATYSLTFTAGNDATLERARVAHNVAIALALGLADTATKAEVLAKDPLADWCTTIEQFIKSTMRDEISAFSVKHVKDDAAKFEEYWASLTPAQKAANIALMQPPPGFVKP